MASCIRNIGTKNYQNLIIGFQATVKNVEDAFLGHSVQGKVSGFFSEHSVVLVVAAPASAILVVIFKTIKSGCSNGIFELEFALEATVATTGSTQ